MELTNLQLMSNILINNQQIWAVGNLKRQSCALLILYLRRRDLRKMTSISMMTEYLRSLSQILSSQSEQARVKKNQTMSFFICRLEREERGLCLRAEKSISGWQRHDLTMLNRSYLTGSEQMLISNARANPFRLAFEDSPKLFTLFVFSLSKSGILVKLGSSLQKLELLPLAYSARENPLVYSKLSSYCFIYCWFSAFIPNNYNKVDSSTFIRSQPKFKYAQNNQPMLQKSTNANEFVKFSIKYDQILQIQIVNCKKSIIYKQCLQMQVPSIKIGSSFLTNNQTHKQCQSEDTIDLHILFCSKFQVDN